jgi:GT2 family glycosyltransferase
LGIFYFILCSYNRSELTFRAISSIYHQENVKLLNFKIILVDDNSQDDTVNLIKSNFPDVDILYGSGNLYWSGAMSLGIQRALKTATFDDYIVLMNDDLYLFQNSVINLVESINFYDVSKSVFVGDILDSKTNKLIYGALKLELSCLKNRYVLDQKIKHNLQTFNGNFVCIPFSVISSYGSLDPVFIHSLGDFDLGLRYFYNKINIVRLPIPVGHTELNEKTPKSARNFKEFISPKYFPIKPFFIYCTRHFGFTGLVIFCSVYMRALFRFIVKYFSYAGSNCHFLL